jgi:hypothetical protein
MAGLTVGQGPRLQCTTMGDPWRSTRRCGHASKTAGVGAATRSAVHGLVATWP